MDDQGPSWLPAILDGIYLAMVLAILLSLWQVETTLSSIARPSLSPIAPGRP